MGICDGHVVVVTGGGRGLGRAQVNNGDGDKNKQSNDNSNQSNKNSNEAKENNNESKDSSNQSSERSKGAAIKRMIIENLAKSSLTRKEN